MEEENENKKFVLFGKDVTKIPCFRNSWLYGISGGIGSGLLYFLFTSKPKVASHVGFSSMIGIAGTYWVFCRYEWSRKTQELQRMKDYVEKKILMEGTEMEKILDIELLDVSTKNDGSV